MTTDIDERSMRAIEGVLEREGGFVDHPSDRGGPTNMGITLDTLRSYRGSPVLPSDIRDLTLTEAVEIYDQFYIKNPKLWLLHHDWLFEIVFDMAVNHGPRRAVLILQKACCVIEDGVLGPITAGVANAMDKATLLRALDRERALYYARIVRNDRTQGDFIVGWVKRMFEVAA